MSNSRGLATGASGGHLHAFVDESIRREYLICAVVVTPSQLSELRQTIKALRVNGSRRVHMAKDSRHASRLVPAFAGLGLSVRIYKAKLSETSQRYPEISSSPPSCWTWSAMVLAAYVLSRVTRTSRIGWLSETRW